jgi:hypothetical protein
MQSTCKLYASLYIDPLHANCMQIADYCAQRELAEPIPKKLRFGTSAFLLMSQQRLFYHLYLYLHLVLVIYKVDCVITLYYIEIARN